MELTRHRGFPSVLFFSPRVFLLLLQRLGSVRGEDLPYIFGLPLVQGGPGFPQNYSRQDMGVNEAVLNFVTNFCKTGDPNEAGHQQAGQAQSPPPVHPDYGTAKERTRFRQITWETYETTTQQYLSICEYKGASYIESRRRGGAAVKCVEGQELQHFTGRYLKHQCGPTDVQKRKVNSIAGELCKLESPAPNGDSLIFGHNFFALPFSLGCSERFSFFLSYHRKDVDK